MKPDKPPSPTRDRDALRARNSRSLKATSTIRTSPSIPPSLSEWEVPDDIPGTSTSTAIPPEEVNSSTSSVSSSSSTPTSSNVEKDNKSAGMKLYLDKLREMVPYVPRSGKISKVDLIHSAIDYITDLQESLEARARKKIGDTQDSSSRPPLAALSPAHVETNNRVTPLSENSSNRQPTLLETNTRHPATLAALASLPSTEGMTSNSTNLSLSDHSSNNAGTSSISSNLDTAMIEPPPSPPL